MKVFKLMYPVKEIFDDKETDKIILSEIKIPERFKAGDLIGTHDNDPILTDFKLISKVSRISLDLVKRIDLADLKVIQDDIQKKLNPSPKGGTA